MRGFGALSSNGSRVGGAELGMEPAYAMWPISFLHSSVTVPLSRCRSLYSPGPYQDGFQGPQGPAIFVEKGALFAMAGLSQ